MLRREDLWTVISSEKEIASRPWGEGNPKICQNHLLPQMPQNFRNAIVMPDGEIGRKNLRFYETVTRNRGLNIRVFETREDALAWLFRE